MQVTTSRSQRSWNIDIPCWDTDVQRLKGCGEETRKKLQDIRKWALKEHNFVPPVGGINQVITVEEWRQLNQEMKSWGPVPRPVRAALTPEKAVEHAEKMLPRDFRMRIFWPQDSQIGAMYPCKQGHVDLANYSSGILLAYNMVDGIRMTWPEGRDAEQSQTMALVARQAELAWRSLDGQVRHPGWFAVKEGTAGEPPLNLDYFGRMETNVNGSLDFTAHELAVFLGLPPSIFERSARALQPGGTLLSQLQGQQPPQPHPYPHPSQGAAPGSRAADAHMPTDGTTPFGSAQAWQLSPSSAAMPETDSDACGLSPLFQYESPRNSGEMLNQQSSEYDPVFPAPPTMPSFHEQTAGSPNMLLASLPHLNNQGILDFNGSITSCEVPGCLSPILAPPGSAQPGLMSPGSGQGLARYGFGQQSNHPAGMLQPQQSPASRMRQDIQDQEHAALAVPAPWVTNERLSQSQIERVRSRELAPTNSFTEREPKRRHTAPAETLEQALQSIYSQYSSGTSLLQGGGRQPTQPHSSTLVAAPTGSIASEPSHHWTVPELSLPITVEGPLSQPTWLQIENQPCAYNLSSDDSSIRDQLNGNDPMSLVARSDGLGDAAYSQQLVADQDQVEVIQRHVQPAVYLFLAKMRALVVRRRQHQHGAVAHSPALESSNRMWQLAVLARFANISRVDLWGDVVARHEGDGLLIPNISAQDLGQNLGQLYQHWCVE